MLMLCGTLILFCLELECSNYRLGKDKSSASHRIICIYFQQIKNFIMKIIITVVNGHTAHTNKIDDLFLKSIIKPEKGKGLTLNLI